MKELIAYNATLTIGFVTVMCGLLINDGLPLWSGIGLGIILGLIIREAMEIWL